MADLMVRGSRRSKECEGIDRRFFPRRRRRFVLKKRFRAETSVFVILRFFFNTALFILYLILLDLEVVPRIFIDFSDMYFMRI